MSIDAMKQALEALEPYARQVVEKGDDYEIAKCDPKVDTAITALRLAIEQAERQEPVAWWHEMDGVVDLNVSGHGVPLYTAPPQRQPLQGDKEGWYWVSPSHCISIDMIRTVEKLHGIGGEHD